MAESSDRSSDDGTPYPLITIGTRGSKLALAQAHLVADTLQAHHLQLRAEGAIAIRIIHTTGDHILDRPLSDIGGKGLFTKEIETALLAGEINLAVHSMKDVPTELPAGLTISCVLEREDPRDAFISLKYSSIEALPQAAKVGTSSLRRRAQLLELRPDLQMVDFRGNVQTRLAKLADGVVDATLLAVAGLNRLNMPDAITQPLSISQMLPAVAQGAIGLEIRTEDTRIAALIAPLHHAKTAQCVAAERALLAALEGNCTTPIAIHAMLDGKQLTMQAKLYDADGSNLREGKESALLGAEDTLVNKLHKKLI